MLPKYLSGIRIVALSCVLCVPVEARISSGPIGASSGTVIGTIVGVGAALAVVGRRAEVVLSA